MLLVINTILHLKSLKLFIHLNCYKCLIIYTVSTKKL